MIWMVLLVEWSIFTSWNPGCLFNSSPYAGEYVCEYACGLFLLIDFIFKDHFILTGNWADSPELCAPALPTVPSMTDTVSVWYNYYHWGTNTDALWLTQVEFTLGSFLILKNLWFLAVFWLILNKNSLGYPIFCVLSSSRIIPEVYKLVASPVLDPSMRGAEGPGASAQGQAVPHRSHLTICPTLPQLTSFPPVRQMSQHNSLPLKDLTKVTEFPRGRAEFRPRASCCHNHDVAADSPSSEILS